MRCCNLTVGDVVNAASESEGLSAGETMEQVREVLTGIAQEGSSEYLQKEKRVDDSALLGSPALVEGQAAE